MVAIPDVGNDSVLLKQRMCKTKVSGERNILNHMLLFTWGSMSDFSHLI